MKDFILKIRKLFAAAVAVILLVSSFVLPTSAIATASSKVSEYVCDFEGNYSLPVNGSVEQSDNGSALKFKVDTSAITHHFEIFNSNNGELKLNDGSVYSVKISYKVENISASVQSDIKTSINLVRSDGKTDNLVKVKAFPNSTYKPGDNTGWITTSVVFKVSVSDSPEFNRLAINVISPSNAASPTGDATYIWFDDIVVTECNGNTKTIDFQSNGGSYCDVIMAQSGEKITLPTPTRDLYDFAGWYTNSELTKKFKADKMPSGLITKLYASWKPSESAIKVEFTDAYDESVVMMVGRSGDKLTLPTPTRRDFHFAGWYLDKELTQKCDYTTFPDASVMLYAKWEVIPIFCGFEDAGIYGLPNDNTLTKRCQISDAEALHGNSALSYNYWKGSNAEIAYRWAAIGGVLLIDEYGEAFQAVPGATYTIKFKYKLNKVDVKNQGNDRGSFGVTLAKLSGAWYDRAVMIDGFTDKSVNYNKSGAGKGWKEGTLTFVAEPLGGSLENSYVYLGIAGDAELVVDDLYIYRADKKSTYDGKCVINFDSQGGSYCETARGEMGETITMPANPVREGYNFVGWCIDPECEIFFTGDKFANVYRKLYAAWGRVNEETPEEDTDNKQEGEPVDKPTDGNAPEDDGGDMMLYIIIGAGALVVIAGAVITVVVVKKKKNK